MMAVPPSDKQANGAA